MIRILEQDVKSQSPENGSQHCKGGKREGETEKCPPRRNPLKTGLSTASSAGAWAIRWDWACGSQSPENGSQHCKCAIRTLKKGAGCRVAIP